MQRKSHDFLGGGHEDGDGDHGYLSFASLVPRGKQVLCGVRRRMMRGHVLAAEVLITAMVITWQFRERTSLL